NWNCSTRRKRRAYKICGFRVRQSEREWCFSGTVQERNSPPEWIEKRIEAGKRKENKKWRNYGGRKKWSIRFIQKVSRTAIKMGSETSRELRTAWIICRIWV